MQTVHRGPADRALVHRGKERRTRPSYLQTDRDACPRHYAEWQEIAGRPGQNRSHRLRERRASHSRDGEGCGLRGPSEKSADINVDDSGNLAWGAEEPVDASETESTNDVSDTVVDTGEVVQDFTITVDSTKKTFSSFAKGRREGEWKTWYANGQLKTYYTYIKDQIEGIFTYYDSAGTTIKTETYKKSI